MPFPFEVPFEQVQENPEVYIEAIFACLVSEFLVLPRGRATVCGAFSSAAYGR